MRTTKHKRALPPRPTGKRKPQPKIGDTVRLTYGETGVITAKGDRPGIFLVKCGGARPMPYRESQFERVP